MASLVIRPLVVAVLVLMPFSATAQDPSPPAGESSQQQLLKPEELDALVAPIALYPDTLLAEVLMASVYPIEVVQAERWLQANKNLKGDQLKATVDKQPWDESIKSLIATPSVLEMMSTKLDWTQKLGDAVLAQQADVMDAIQRLRARAQANNKLTSTNEQTVIVQQVEGRQVIAIQPTDPGTVYVPYYDPGVVYGGWPYPAYPPYYFPAPGYIAAGIVATGIAFGAGYALGRWVSGRNYWGGGVNWSGNNITINNRPGNRPGNLPGNRPSNPISNVGNKWQPRVEHRQGVGNRGNRQQLDFRGRGGQKVLNPGGGRGGLGQRNRPANRPAAGTGPSRGHHAAHRGGGRGRGKVATGGGRGGGRVTAGGGRGGGRVTTGGGRRGGKVATGASRGGGRVTAGGGRRGGAMRVGGGRGGAMRARGGRGGMRAGGGRGRRSDLRLKHDITLLGHLDNGLGFYRFSYNGSSKAYVGVIAQEVQQVMPQAVAHGRDGYLVVNYEKLGLKFESYKQWIDSGAQVPNTTQVPH